MSLVVVERSFEVPVVFEQVQEAQVAVEWCLTQHRVELSCTYLSKDRRRMLSLYDAPDAEAVRATQKTGALPYDEIWSARHLLAPDPKVTNPKYESIVVRRLLPRSMTLEEITALMEQGMNCMGLYRVDFQESFIAPDGQNMICRYRAPDAESVRLANQKAGVPFVRAWASTRHPAD